MAWLRPTGQKGSPATWVGLDPSHHPYRSSALCPGILCIGYSSTMFIDMCSIVMLGPCRIHRKLIRLYPPGPPVRSWLLNFFSLSTRGGVQISNHHLLTPGFVRASGVQETIGAGMDQHHVGHASTSIPQKLCSHLARRGQATGDRHCTYALASMLVYSVAIRPLPP